MLAKSFQHVKWGYEIAFFMSDSGIPKSNILITTGHYTQQRTSANIRNLPWYFNLWSASRRDIRPAEPLAIPIPPKTMAMIRGRAFWPDSTVDCAPHENTLRRLRSGQRLNDGKIGGCDVADNCVGRLFSH